MPTPQLLISIAALLLLIVLLRFAVTWLAPKIKALRARKRRQMLTGLRALLSCLEETGAMTRIGEGPGYIEYRLDLGETALLPEWHKVLSVTGKAAEAGVSMHPNDLNKGDRVRMQGFAHDMLFMFRKLGGGLEPNISFFNVPDLVGKRGSEDGVVQLADMDVLRYCSPAAAEEKQCA